MRIALLIPLALTACFDPDVGRDRDDDGFQTWELGGEDCDDSNASVNPSASEACGNGIDDDCDGFIDDMGVGQVEYYLDLDGDGVAGPTPHYACVPETGSFADLTRGVDCDDDDPNAFPGNPETYYDGVDGDCLGGDDFDADQDGYPAPAGGGEDCDDANDTVNPGSEEICNNGVDDDCDGGPGPCEYRGTYDIADVAVATRPTVLVDVEWADLDGDGVSEVIFITGNLDADLFVEVHSQAGLRSGQFPMLTLAFPFSDGGGWPELVANGDYDGDGLVDLVAWAGGGARVWRDPLGAAEVTDITFSGTGTLRHVATFTQSNNPHPDKLAIFANGDGFTWSDGNGAATIEVVGASINLSDPALPSTPVARIFGGPEIIFADGVASLFAEYALVSGVPTLLQGRSMRALFGDFEDGTLMHAGGTNALDVPGAIVLQTKTVPMGDGRHAWMGFWLFPFYPSIASSGVGSGVVVSPPSTGMEPVAIPQLAEQIERTADEDGPVVFAPCVLDLDRDGVVDVAQAVGYGNSDNIPQIAPLRVKYNGLLDPMPSEPDVVLTADTRPLRLFCQPDEPMWFVMTSDGSYVMETRGM